MFDRLILGKRIKKYRLERDLTLKEVEQKAKVSATHVSEIERGMTSPTIRALVKISAALGVEPAYLLSPGASNVTSVVRRSERRPWGDRGWRAQVTALVAEGSSAEMSIFEIDLEAGGEHNRVPCAPVGEVFITVSKGVIEVYVERDRYLMKEKDSIHFDARHPHTIRNIGDGPARVVWVSRPATRF